MKPIEDTIIATVQAEKEIKSIMTNVNQELSVTAQDIRIKSVGNEYITKMKETLKK